MSATSRREFLAWLGAAGVAAASGGFLADRLFALLQEGELPAPRGPRLERHVSTLCRLCPAGCGLRVRLVDGLPVGLAGDPAHPLTRGGLCAAGLAGLHETLHPDRLRTPLRREGPRGGGRWRAISWDEALEDTARALRSLAAEGRPEAFAVLERGDSPLTSGWLRRVLGAFGAPGPGVPEAAPAWRHAWRAVSGSGEPPAPDLERSDFILSFGHELFETDGHSVWQARAWAGDAGPGDPPRAALVYVGPRASATALRSDLHLAIRPGGEAAAARGILHVLLEEGFTSRDFAIDWARGGDGDGSPDPPWRTLPPALASREAGVPAEHLVRVARAFGSARRPVALAGPAALAGPDAAHTAVAVLALDFASGSVGRAGGLVGPGGWPGLLPASAGRGVASGDHDRCGAEFGGEQSAAAAGRSRDGVLLVHGVNPAFEWPDARAAARALDAARLVVVMAPLADETAHLADLVLPEAGFLECAQILPAPACVPADFAGLQRPVLGPLYGSRSFEDALFDLARRVGGEVAAAVPAGTYHEWLREAAGPAWPELERSGVWCRTRAGEPSPRELLPAGRSAFDLAALAAFARGGLRGSPRPRSGATDAPHESEADSPNPIEPSASGAAQNASIYPLTLLLFDTATLRAGRTASTPLMLELAGPLQDAAWESWVELHPATARALGVTDGARVRVESVHGAVEAPVRVLPTVARDVVAMPVGLGHTSFGRYAANAGGRAWALLPPDPGEWDDARPRSIRVRVTAERA